MRLYNILLLVFFSITNISQGQSVFPSYEASNILIKPLGLYKAQQLKNVITLKVDSLSLSEILNRIEGQCDYFFVYTDSEISANKKFSINAKKPLDNLLDELLYPLNIRYKVFGKQIVLNGNKKKFINYNKTKQESFRQSSFGLIDGSKFNNYAMANRIEFINNEISVEGVVSDENDNPLPGVNIIEKGSTNGAVTDASGAFKINVRSNESVLIFSFIGYLTQEVKVNDQSVINSKMLPDLKTLGEVVVIGYGEQKRSDLTGAISSVKYDDIKNLPVKSVADALQGRVAGLYITAADGKPGSQPNITLRGAGNLGGIAPLYVVDGMPFFDTGYNFNPQDIESIEVIKDASAAAIYGAQASGGVILITTKKGKSGKIKVGVNTTYGVRKAMNLPEQLHKDDYIKAKVADGTNPNTFGDVSKLPDTDWYGALFKPAAEQNYTIYLSGGSEKSNFYSSANYQNTKGILIDSKIERYTLRLNSDHQLNKKLKIGQTFFGSFSNENPPNINIPLGFRTSPLNSIYDSTNLVGGWGRDTTYQRGNPVGSQYTEYRRNQKYNINSSINLSWEVVKGLYFKTNAGINAQFDNNYYFNYKVDFGQVKNPQDFYGREVDSKRDLLINYTLTYEKNIGDHTLKGLIGYEARKHNETYIGAQSFSPQVPLAQNTNLSAAPSKNVTAFSGSGARRILSQFARLDYSYKGKYLLQVNYSRNGVSDIFGPANKYGSYPSMSAGWKISEEQFMTSIPQVTNLKLRASYGQLGNYQGIPAFKYQNYYDAVFANDFADGKGLVKGEEITNLPNEKIRWETLVTTNIGIDLGLFQNKLNLTVDWYNRQTKDMIFNVIVPPSSGFGNTPQDGNPYSLPVNIGQMNNKGVEFALSYENKIGQFSYSINANGAMNRNKLVSLNSNVSDQSIPSGRTPEFTGNQIPSRSVVGKPLGQFWGYVADGIYQADAPEGPTFSSAKPKAGDLIYRDINKDGIINGGDQTFIGNPWPKLTYGFSLSGAWKALDLRLFFVGVQGVDIYNTTESYEHYFVSGDYTSSPKIFETSKFNGNGVTSSPRPSGRNWAQLSSYHVHDGSFLRLKNLQIGYTFSTALLSRLHASSVRIFIMTDNLLTFTKYNGMDPESALSGENIKETGLSGEITKETSTVTAKGIDNSLSRYPLSRLYSIGLNVEF